MQDNCIFCKIIAGSIPATKRYEDEHCIIIDDISPVAAKHYILIPKPHYAMLADADAGQAAQLGKAVAYIGVLAEALGLQNGFRLVVNQGKDANQTVGHLHVHIIGGQGLGGIWDEALLRSEVAAK